MKLRILLSACVVVLTGCATSNVTVPKTTKAPEAVEVPAVADVTKTSIADLQRRAAAGEAKAQAELGARYGRGDGVPQDLKKAIDLLEAAARQNDPDAEFYIGTAFSTGMGLQRSEEQAVLWYEKAADQGHAAAQYWLGLMIAKGLGGIEASPRAAIPYFWNSAAQDYPPAEFLLASAFDTGFGVEANVRAAAYWYRRMLSHGPHAQAMYNLRTLIERGQVEWQAGDPGDPPELTHPPSDKE